MLGLLRFLVAVELVAGVTLAVTVDRDEARVATSDTPSTTVPTPSATASTVPTTTTAQRPAPTTTTTAAPPPSLKPTPSGEYRYRLRTTVDGQTETTDGRWAYFSAREFEGELTQVLLDMPENRDFDHIWTRVSRAWRDDGLYVRSMHEYYMEEDDEECHLEPDLLVAPSPVVVGVTWRSTTSCATYGTSVRFDVTSTVVRMDHVSVGGTRVAVYVIETRGAMTVEDVQADVYSVGYFNVDLGFNVREELTYQSEGVVGQETYELLSLTPTPLQRTTSTTTSP